MASSNAPAAAQEGRRADAAPPRSKSVCANLHWAMHLLYCHGVLAESERDRVKRRINKKREREFAGGADAT